MYTNKGDMMLYGIYNTKAKKYQFGIQEPSKKKARESLFKKIGNDARKWKFEVRAIKNITSKEQSNETDNEYER